MQCSFFIHLVSKENNLHVDDLSLKKRASFHSNLLHHTRKIQWIRPCTPELSIIVEMYCLRLHNSSSLSRPVLRSHE
uniref:Uncharacterized protein n=1 Tax=Mastacembelus armatus TaxID=205130 RepID=A0A3Q3NHL8_9TELE